MDPGNATSRGLSLIYGCGACGELSLLLLLLDDLRALNRVDGVDEGARGLHVGSSLYHFVCSWAREHGFYNVTLNVWSCNPKAQGFYEAMGLKPYKVGMECIL